MNAYEYAAAHHAAFLTQLKELVATPSVSTQTEHHDDIRHAAAWLVAELERIGLHNVKSYTVEADDGKTSHPIVYGEWLNAPGKPTALIYGHYDVQPADQVKDQWATDPFTPTERDGNLYARGSTDDKGQVFAHLKALESLFQVGNGSLPINVKVLIEGEEELGSVNIDHFVTKYQDMLRADVLVISDSHILASDRPLITTALRGLIYTEIQVNGPKTDLHSGSYGGVVYNPLQALCEIVAGLHHADGSIAVPGFYDAVRPISPAEHAAIEQVPWTDDEFEVETGLRVSTGGEQRFSRRERVGLRPTLEVNGIFGGYIEPGQKTVLPATATAKVSCRLVANQDPLAIFDLLQKYVAELTPAGVHSEVRLLSTGGSARMSIASPAIDAAAAAYERGFGARPVFLPEGGSIPIVAMLQELYHFPALLIGFGLPDDNLHGPNEKFRIDHFYRGIDTLIALYERLGQMTPQAVAQEA